MPPPMQASSLLRNCCLAQPVSRLNHALLASSTATIYAACRASSNIVDKAVRMAKSGPNLLSAHELLEEFERLALAGRPAVWHLDSHNIQPQLVRELFQLIQLSGLELQTPIAVDLEDNCLDSATADDFKAILQAMQTAGLEQLLVRLGFKIVFPYLKAAMAELGAEHLFNNRVFVSLPWEGGTLALSNKLSGTIEKLNLMNDVQAKQLAAMEQRLTKVKLKDPEEQLRQMKVYRDTDNHLVEECVSRAVAAMLEDAVVVHATRYEFQGANAGLDGMVVGRWQGRDVVVLVESKHNMDSSTTRAKAELFAAKQYWEALVRFVDGPEADESTLADYQELEVESYRDHTIMFAFGGSTFSAQTVTKSFGNVTTPWFRVVANSVGKFVAEFQAGVL